MATKFWLYSSASLLACAGLLYYTYLTRQQFYPAVIYLVTSKISVLVLGNGGLVLTILLGRLVKSFFLGTLRDAEVEILHENVRYAITETCLALTIFREEINFQVVVLFTSLVFLKIFHWLSQSRIEYIEQTDVVSRLTHIRLVALMGFLAAIDTTFVVLCGMKVHEIGPSVFILFGFEFLILLITLIVIFLRYVLYVIDARRDGNWAYKFTYLFYLELISEIIKLVLYMGFFAVIFTYYGMPIHIIRDLWMSMKNLQRRIASYFRYRKITSNLNERFPNPTESELEETDRTCIICREEMTTVACKKLPCTHIFHVDCLKMWVQRQQTCPTCRSTIPTNTVRPPVIPQVPPAQAAANDAPAVVPGVPVAAAPVPAPPAQAVGVPPHIPTPQAAPVQPPVQGAVHQVAPPATQAPQAHTTHQPGLHTPTHFPPGYMPPYMFAPGMGGPYGYGMIPPPFGFPMGHPTTTNGTHEIPQHPGMDPAVIQQHLQQLHAQLVDLQARMYGVPNSSIPGVMLHPPATTPLQASVAVSAPITPPMQAPVPPPTHPVQAMPFPAQSMPPVVSPNLATPATEPLINRAAHVTIPPTSSPSTTSSDDNEDKAPIPTSSVSTSNEDTLSSAETTAPVEMEIPRAMTEAERRREELRQRYARIYGNADSSSDSTN